MAAIREGGAVAQLTFVPSEEVSIGADPFVTLVRRAQERLRELPRLLGRLHALATTFPRGHGSHPCAPTRSHSPWPPGCSSPAAAPSGPTATPEADASFSPASTPTATPPSAGPAATDVLAGFPLALGYDDRERRRPLPRRGDRQAGDRAFSECGRHGLGPAWPGTSDVHRRRVPRRGRVAPRPDPGALPSAALSHGRGHLRSRRTGRLSGRPRGTGVRHHPHNPRHSAGRPGRSCGPTPTGSSVRATSCTTPV